MEGNVAEAVETAVDNTEGTATIGEPGEQGSVGDGTGFESAPDTNDTGGFGEGKLDPQQADAHRGEIVSVALKVAGTGTVGLAIQTKSNDTGIANNGFLLMIWGPADLFDAESPVWASGRMDTSKLSKESPGLNDKGQAKQSPFQSYSRNFFNDKKTGTVQLAYQAAAEEGRTPGKLSLPSPTSPEELVANMNAVLAGANVVIVRAPESNTDPSFDGQLKVKGLFPISSLNDPKFVNGKLKNSRKMWE